MRLYHLKYKARSGEWTESKTWWVQFSVRGKLCRKSLQTKDKRVAQMRALKLVDREERKALGLCDPFEEHRERPLREHVEDFAAHLKAKGVSDDHHKDRMYCLRGYLGMTRAKTLADVDLVEAHPPEGTSGIIILRPTSQDAPTVLALLRRLLPLLADGAPKDALWVVERDRVRVRRSRSDG